MRLLIALLAIALPVFGAGTVTCSNSSGDASAIQSAVNGGGTTTVIGPCSINSQVVMSVSGSSLIGSGTSGSWFLGPPLNTPQSGALWTSTSNGAQILNLNANNLTVNNIFFEQGGVVSSHAITNLNFNHNKIADLTNSGGIPDGLQTNGMHQGSVSYNVFDNIMIGGYSDLTSQFPFYSGPIDSACWADYPGSTSSDGGLDGTIVQHNSFTRCGNDGFHINPNGHIQAQSVISISYNYCALVHRACFEIQTSLGNSGLDMRSNVAINANAPFYDTFAYSIATNGNFGELGIFFYNNLGSLNNQYCEGGVATFFEIGSAPGIAQGNVNMQLPINAAPNPPPYPPQSPASCFTFSSGGSSAHSPTFIAASGGNNTTSPLNTVTTQNNVMCGNNEVATFDSFDGYPGQRNLIDQYNYKNLSSCPGRPFVSSNVGTPVFTSANNQSFPSGGNGTWSLSEISGLPISNVSFYIDGSSTPIVLQEIQDVNTNFPSDQKWLYHATINTTGLSGGAHTIKAIATDVLGGTAQSTQNFSTGSGPGVSFSSPTLAFGTITLGNTSPPQTNTLTNTGTTNLVLSSTAAKGGANPGDFNITSNTCTSGTTIAAGATCSVTVTFTPTVLGPRSAQIMVSDNAAGSPHIFQLTGGASVCQPGNILTVCDFANGPNSLAVNGGPWLFSGGSFGTVQVDNTGPGGVFAAHITATSSVPLGNNIELYQDGLTFPPNGHMMQLTASCASTPSQGVNILGILDTSPFTSFGLSWQPDFPTTFGTYPNCVGPYQKVINSPAAGTGRVTFQTDGAGPGSQIYITNVNLLDVGSVPASQPSVSSVNFGNQGLGTTGTASAFTITNGGIVNLIISAIGYSTGNPSDFGQTNTCGTLPATITPGSSCSVTPTFTPSASGLRTSNLVITSNDSSTSPQSIGTSGTGMGTTEVVGLQSLITSHGSIYFAMTTQSNSIGVRIRYGTVSCSSAPAANNTNVWLQTNYINSVPAAFSAFTIGGLPAVTPIHICPEVTKDGSTWSTGFDQVITTLALPNPHPALPKPPLTFNTNYPNTSGFNVQSVSTNATFSTAYGTGCTDWQTNKRGQIINIAAGTQLNGGPYAFTCDSPDLHTIAASDFTLPSTLNWPSHGFSEGDLVEFGVTYASNVVVPGGGGCNVGKGSIATGGIQVGQLYPVHLVDSNNIQIRCLPSYQPNPALAPAVPPIMVWTSGPFYNGSDHMVAVAYKNTGNDKNGNPVWQRRLPTSPYALTPAFIIQSAGALPPEHTAITPAWQSKLFSFHATASSYISSFALQHPFIVFGDVDPNVQKPTGPYRITGCEITTDNYNPSSPDPYFWSTLVYTHPWDDQIIFDRCYYHIPDGNREFRGQQWDGSQQAWVDSYFGNLVYMKSAVSPAGSLNLTTTGAHTLSITPGKFTTPELATYTLASTETITVTGSGSGRVRVYWDAANAGAFTVGVPASVTASCSPVSCVNVASTAAPNGSCVSPLNINTSVTFADFPHYSSGESSAAPVGCADMTSGSVTTAGPANVSVSQWNAEGDTHMIGGVGPGPYLFCDNYYDGAGITWHFDDSGGFNFRGNYTWCRNYGKASTKWMFGSPDSLNLIPGNRQQLEWKGGQYASVLGNIFDGSFRDDIPDSAAIAWQPLNGGLVTDVNFVGNTVKNGSAILQGPTNTCGGTATSCGLSMRFHLDNTLTYNINGYFFTSPDPDGNNGPGLGWGNQFSAVEDVFVDHQTDGTPPRGATTWIASNTSVAIEGYVDKNSIHWFSGVPNQITSQYGDGSGQAPGVPPGCSGLTNFSLMNCQFTPSYLFNNLILGGYTDNSTATGQSTVSTMTTAYGSNANLYLATGTVAGTTTAVKWANPVIDDTANWCLLPASPYKAGNSALTHASDIGIDCNRFDADQGNVDLKGVPASTLGASTASVAYVAPDSGVCYVGASTTNNITTASFTADGGGARARIFAITGLTTKTHYFGFLSCSGNYIKSQRSFDFWTN